MNGIDWNRIALKALIYGASKRKTPQNLSSTGLGILAEGESAERPRCADVLGLLGILYATLYAT